jgi:hypothetical protein
MKVDFHESFETRSEAIKRVKYLKQQRAEDFIKIKSFYKSFFIFAA